MPSVSAYPQSITFEAATTDGIEITGSGFEPYNDVSLEFTNFNTNARQRVTGIYLGDSGGFVETVPLTEELLDGGVDFNAEVQTYDGYTYNTIFQVVAGPRVKITPNTATAAEMTTTGAVFTGSGFTNWQNLSNYSVIAPDERVHYLGSGSTGADGSFSYGVVLPGSFVKEAGTYLCSVDYEGTQYQAPLEISGAIVPEITSVPSELTAAQAQNEGFLVEAQHIDPSLYVLLKAVNPSNEETTAASGFTSSLGNVSFNAYLYAPFTDQPGTYTIYVANGNNDEKLVETTIEILPTVYDPSVRLTVDNMSVDDAIEGGITVIGNGFPADSLAEFYITPPDGERVIIGQGSTDYEGFVIQTIQLDDSTAQVGQSSVSIVVTYNGEEYVGQASLVLTGDTPVYNPEITVTPKYAPTENATEPGVQVGGQGFFENADVTIRFDSPTGFDVSYTTTSDGVGEFHPIYKLAPSFVENPGTYTVTVTATKNGFTQGPLTTDFTLFKLDPPVDPVFTTPNSLSNAQAVAGFSAQGVGFEANSLLTLSASNPAGQTISLKTLNANPDGSFLTSVVLPVEFVLNAGLYTLTVRNASSTVELSNVISIAGPIVPPQPGAAYATAEDVYKRIGFYDTAGEESLQEFLDEFSLILDMAIERKGLDPSSVNLKLKRSLAISKGMKWVYLYDVDPTVSSRSNAVGDVSESESRRSVSIDSLYDVSHSDFKRIGVSTFKISSINTGFQWGN